MRELTERERARYAALVEALGEHAAGAQEFNPRTQQAALRRVLELFGEQREETPAAEPLELPAELLDRLKVAVQHARDRRMLAVRVDLEDVEQLLAQLAPVPEVAV